MADSIEWGWSSAPNSFANRRPAERDRRSAMRRSMNTVSDASPIVTRSAPTTFAGRPMLFHISIRLNVMSSLSPSSRKLEWNLYYAVDGDRLALVSRRLVLPRLHRLHGRADERLVPTHHLHVGNHSVRQDHHFQHDRAGLARGARFLGIWRDPVGSRRPRPDGVLGQRDGSAHLPAERAPLCDAALEPRGIALARLAVHRHALVFGGTRVPPPS